MSGSSVTRVFDKEVLVVPLLTAGAYFFTFKFFKGYLSHFGFGPEFIEVSVIDVLFAAGSLVTIGVIALHTLNVIPVRFLGPAFLLVYAWFIPALFFFLSISAYISSGFTWWLVGFATLSIVTFLLASHDIYAAWKKGEKYFDSIVGSLKGEAQFREKFVGSKLMDGFADRLGTAGFLFLVFVVFAGEPLGGYWAGREAKFTFSNRDEQSYLIVRPFKDGFLIAEVMEREKETPETVLTGATGFLASNDLVMHSLIRSKERLEILQKDPQKEPSRTKRTTLNEFLTELGWGADSDGTK